MEVKLATTDAQIEAVCPVLLELRPQYDAQSLAQRIRMQQQQGYQLAYVDHDGKVLSAAGFVVGEKLAWGRHLYVDDLVTAAAHRSSGAGKLIMDWLKDYGREQGCGQLHLDSGVQRFRAHRFYLREGFNINSHHFAITDLNEHSS